MSRSFISSNDYFSTCFQAKSAHFEYSGKYDFLLISIELFHSNSIWTAKINCLLMLCLIKASINKMCITTQYLEIIKYILLFNVSINFKTYEKDML